MTERTLYFVAAALFAVAAAINISDDGLELGAILEIAAAAAFAILGVAKGRSKA